MPKRRRARRRRAREAQGDRSCLILTHNFVLRILAFFLAPCSCTLFLHFGLALARVSKGAEQNLLIVTVMSFDRAVIIKHNRHVQTRAVFPPSQPDIARAGLPVFVPFLWFVCAKRKDSLEFVMCGRLAGEL